VIYEDYGFYLTRPQITNISHMQAIAGAIADDLETKSNISDCDMLFKCFQDNGAYYISLFHREDVALKELISGDKKKKIDTNLPISNNVARINELLLGQESIQQNGM
jgi:hypothetical protein